MQVLSRVFRLFGRILSPIRHAEATEGWLQGVLQSILPGGGAVVAIGIAWLTSQPPEVIALVGVSSFLALSLLAGYGLLSETDNYKSGTPVLHFSEPSPHPDEQVDFTPAMLWRIQVENTQRGTQAENVRVRMHTSDPPLKILPVSLHQMHDNTAPFKQVRDIAFGEPIIFDVISQDDGQQELIYLFRSDTALEVPDDMLDRESAQLVLGAASGDGFLLRIRAVADPPTRGIEQAYRLVRRTPLDVGASQHGLVMEREGDAVTL